MEAVLRRIEALQPKVHAFISVSADEAREAARSAGAAVMAGQRLGPLHGVPLSVKGLRPDRDGGRRARPPAGGTFQ